MNNYLKMDADQLSRDIDALIDEYPELADDEQLRADMLEGSTELHNIVAKALEQSQRSGEVVKGIADRQSELAERKKRYGRKQEAMRGLIFKIMERADLPKIELDEATISVRAGVPKVEYTGDPLPDEFTRTEVKPDAAKIKNALKEGQAVPGAMLSNAQPSLTVRIK